MQKKLTGRPNGIDLSLLKENNQKDSTSFIYNTYKVGK